MIRVTTPWSRRQAETKAILILERDIRMEMMMRRRRMSQV